MSLLHGSANSGTALRERSAAGEWAAASEMDFIFLVVSRLAQAPLIDCGCPHTFLYPASRVRHERAQARRAQSRQEDMLRSPRTISSVGCASLSQDGPPRVRNAAQTNGAQTPSPASVGSTCPPETIG